MNKWDLEEYLVFTCTYHINHIFFKMYNLFQMTEREEDPMNHEQKALLDRDSPIPPFSFPLANPCDCQLMFRVGEALLIHEQSAVGHRTLDWGGGRIKQKSSPSPSITGVAWTHYSYDLSHNISICHFISIYGPIKKPIKPDNLILNQLMWNRKIISNVSDLVDLTYYSNYIYINYYLVNIHFFKKKIKVLLMVKNIILIQCLGFRDYFVKLKCWEISVLYIDCILSCPLKDLRATP